MTIKNQKYFEELQRMNFNFSLFFLFFEFFWKYVDFESITNCCTAFLRNAWKTSIVLERKSYRNYKRNLKNVLDFSNIIDTTIEWFFLLFISI